MVMHPMANSSIAAVHADVKAVRIRRPTPIHQRAARRSYMSIKNERWNCDQGRKSSFAQNQKNEWLFPKGHLEQGENLQQAAEREIEEEPGVIAKATDYLGKVNYTFQGDHYEVHFFLMKHLRNTDSWSQHHNVDVFLFPPEEALNLLRFDSYKEQLRLALGKLKK
jgi:8-oxo-dGTP pyrophosphatase MutT (NUDIX family)